MVSDRLNGIDDIAEVCLFKMISDCWRKPLVHLLGSGDCGSEDRVEWMGTDGPGTQSGREPGDYR